MQSGTPAHEGIPSGLIVETDAMAAAHLVRREPYLLLFPLGALLGFCGVAHWLLHAVGLLADFRPVFHTVTQVQGFLMSFATGFLLTMIPRRTGSSPPSAVELGIALGAPLVTVVAAWGQHGMLAQGAWLVLALTLILFVARRFLSRTSRRRPPNAFVWIPLAIAIGVAGSIATLVGAQSGHGESWTLMGRGLLFQGMFLALTLGVGSLALPLMMRGEAPADAGSSKRDRLLRSLNVAAGCLLVLSFWIGVEISARLGFLIRGGIVLVVLLATAHLWRAPRPAWNARSIWTAAWMLPLGLLIAAARPDHFRLGLHVTFLGGFALLALAVSTQVVLGHGGRPDLMLGRPRPVAAIAALVVLATVPRGLMETDPQRYFLWMALAATLFLAALVVWFLFTGSKILNRLASSARRAESER